MIFWSLNLGKNVRLRCCPWSHVYMDVSENSGTPKSSISIGFSIINHPFCGTPLFGNTHIYIYNIIYLYIYMYVCLSMFDIVSWLTHHGCHLRYVYLKWTPQSFICQAKTMRPCLMGFEKKILPILTRVAGKLSLYRYLTVYLLM